MSDTMFQQPTAQAYDIIIHKLCTLFMNLLKHCYATYSQPVCEWETGMCKVMCFTGNKHV